jgi:hypothetical protein
MKHKPRPVLALLVAVAALATAATAAAPASAASDPVIKDCVAHGALTKPYSIRQLNQALGALSPSTREYTNCQDVINRALASGVSGKGGGGTGSGGSGSFLPTPVIIVLVVLALAAVTFAAVAIRRRGQNTAG